MRLFWRGQEIGEVSTRGEECVVRCFHPRRNLLFRTERANWDKGRVVHTEVHNNVVYDVLPMTCGAVRALLCR